MILSAAGEVPAAKNRFWHHAGACWALVLWFYDPFRKKEVDANVAALKKKRGE